MMPIQALLLLCVAAAVYLYVSRLRSTLLDRLLVLAAAGVVMVLILVPDWSTTLAQKFGVGRGVDFIFYLSHTVVALVLILLYGKTRTQAARITELTRALALVGARPAPDGDANPEAGRAPAIPSGPTAELTVPPEEAGRERPETRS